MKINVENTKYIIMGNDKTGSYESKVENSTEKTVYYGSGLPLKLKK